MPQPTFHPRRIRLGSAALLLLAVLLVYLGIFEQERWLLQWVIPICVAAGALVIKWAAPAVPWSQVVLTAGIVLGVHWLGHVASIRLGAPLLLVADYAIEFLCVGVLGRTWVKKGFIPSSANAWH